MLLRPNIQYIAFDDRWMSVTGILVLSLIVPHIFFGMEITAPWNIKLQEYLEAFSYTFIFWVFYRNLCIRLRKKYNTFDKTFKRFSLQLMSSIVIVPLFSLIITFFINQVYQFFRIENYCEPTTIQGIGSTFFITFSMLMLYEVIYFFHKYKEAIVEKEQIQQEHLQGQLDNLRNQINPHFLFNSLNTLMNLIPTDSDRAMNYLSKLSKFYRYAVSQQEEALVPLQTEMDNVRIYADLLHERFQQGITILLPEQIPSKTKILPLCLQLLIENAVKHNIVALKKPLSIRVIISEDQEYIQVQNNIQKKIQEVRSTGMGLKNIQRRVAFFSPKPLLVEESQDSFTVSVPLIHSN